MEAPTTIKVDDESTRLRPFVERGLLLVFVRVSRNRARHGRALAQKLLIDRNSNAPGGPRVGVASTFGPTQIDWLLHLLCHKIAIARALEVPQVS